MAAMSVVKSVVKSAVLMAVMLGWRTEQKEDDRMEWQQWLS